MQTKWKHIIITGFRVISLHRVETHCSSWGKNTQQTQLLVYYLFFLLFSIVYFFRVRANMQISAATGTKMTRCVHNWHFGHTSEGWPWWAAALTPLAAALGLPALRGFTQMHIAALQRGARCCWGHRSPSPCAVTCRLTRLFTSSGHLGLTSKHAPPPPPPRFPSLFPSSPFPIQATPSPHVHSSRSDWLRSLSHNAVNSERAPLC